MRFLATFFTAVGVFGGWLVVGGWWLAAGAQEPPTTDHQPPTNYQPPTTYQPPGTWSEKARLGEQRTEAAVVSINGKIYVLGGMARGQDSHPLNQEYDPATDRWRERAPMPSPLSHAGAAAMNGRIYVVGGFLRNSTWMHRVSPTNTTRRPTPGVRSRRSRLRAARSASPRLPAGSTRSAAGM